MAIHIVQSGETIWGISQKYNVSIQSIVDVNGIENVNKLIPNLALYIPNNTLQLRYYRVQQGDTLWQIAQRFQTTIESIVSTNPNLTINQLYIGQTITIPSPLKMSKNTLGFIIPYNVESFLASFAQMAGQLTYLAVVAYSFTDAGYAYVELDDDAIIQRSKQLNVTPLLMIRNYKNGDFDRQLVGSVLENETYRRNLINSIVNLARVKGYGGVSIDFEFIPPPQRNTFITFLNDLKEELGPLLLHVNVHAKTEDIPTNPIIGAYGYEAIGKVADIVAVMTIDYGYPTGPPDPVSPLWWMHLVIRYSIQFINPKKLQIALPLYGYDKVIDTYRTRALSIRAAQNLAISTGAIINYDSIAAASFYKYWEGTEGHIVWFDDIRSFYEKYRLLDLYQLNGVTYWQLSLPFPQNWAYVRQNLNVLKS